MKPAIVIVMGPTASGKSGLAVRLAHALDGEVVNADCMQVYRGMDIGTAKPGVEEREGVPHHLLDILDPNEPFSASDFAARADASIAEIAARGRVPIVCGGTAFYIKALTKGLFKGPEAQPEVRARLEAMLAEVGPESLHERLEEVDPEAAARIHPHDRQRILRALEVWEVVGEPLSELQRRHGFSESRYRAFKCAWDWPRDVLYERINRRTREMLSGGLIEEVQRLTDAGYGERDKALRAIGYKQVREYLAGALTREALEEEVAKATRRYAKRQLTWLRAEEGLQWYSPEGFARLLDHVRAHLAQSSMEESA